VDLPPGAAVWPVVACKLLGQSCCLANSTNLPTGLYILLVLISFFFFFFTLSKTISLSTGPIFTIFSPSRDVAMVTNFVWYLTFLLGVEVSQDTLDRFSQSSHRMVRMELQMINPTFFRYLKQPILWQNFLPPCTYRSGIQKRQLLDLRQPFSISSHMYRDYKTDISFVLAQRTLPW